MKQSEIELSESLKSRFRGFERRLRLAEAAIAVSGALSGLFAAYTLLFISDRLWDTPLWLRLPLFAAGTFIAAAFCAWWLYHWLWNRRDRRQLAKLVQKKHSRLGDRLLGAVELAEQKEPASNLSPALCRAAIRQVSGEAARCRFEDAVPERRRRVYGTVFAAILLLALTPFLFWPSAGYNALLRWGTPLADVNRFTFVRIHDMPSKIIVPRGEPFEISFTLKPDSRWRPGSASCRFENQPVITAAVTNKTATFRVPGQVEPGTAFVAVGDLRREVTVIPMFRPGLTELTARVEMPAYLERRPRTVDLLGSSAGFIEGSRITISGKTARTLSSAELTVFPSDSESSSSRPSSRYPLDTDGETFTSPVLSPEALGKCSLSWTDLYGLAPREPYVLNVESTVDEPPFVECSGIARAVAILRHEILDFEVRTEDDFGVKMLWIEWNSEAENGEEPRLDGGRLIASGSPVTNRLSGSYTFSPLAEGIPEGSAVSLAAYAVDYYPGRKPSASLTRRIYILSRAEHADLVRRRMERVQAVLEDIARSEENQISRNADMSERSPEELATEKTGSDLRRSAERETDNSERLSDLASDGEKVLREALKNPDIEEDTLRRWAQHMKSLRDTARTDMREAASSLSRARGARGDERRSELRDAISLEKSALRKMRNTETRINNSVENMIARSFANRLLMAAKAEKGVAASLEEQLPRIIGLPRDSLTSEARAGLDAEAAGQDNIRVEVKYVRDDLAGFYTRTRIERYNTLCEKIREAEAVRELGKLGEAIKSNLVVKSIEDARRWAEQLEEWAGALNEAAESCGRETEGEPLTEADMELLISLMRARRAEEDIRRNTRLLDQSARSTGSYEREAKQLSDRQYELARDVRPLGRKVRSASLRMLVQKVAGEMMNAGISLRKPQTDQRTIAIETEIIELLSNSIKSCSQQSAAGMQLAMLMQALGMQGMTGAPGAGGGGSTAGGDTSRPNETGGGDSGSDSLEPRDVDKTGGRSTGNWPREYRDMLEAYFRKTETEGEAR
ncbi:MAG: hypothetical protein R6V03_10380 [Kiritimatiellia bacterium]